MQVSRFTLSFSLVNMDSMVILRSERCATFTALTEHSLCATIQMCIRALVILAF